MGTQSRWGRLQRHCSGCMWQASFVRKPPQSAAAGVAAAAAAARAEAARIRSRSIVTRQGALLARDEAGGAWRTTAAWAGFAQRLRLLRRSARGVFAEAADEFLAAAGD